MKTVRTLSWCWKDCGGHVPFHFLWWECKLVHREVHLAYLTVFECVYILHASKSIFKSVPYRNTSMNPWRCIYERMSDTDFLLLSEKIGINPGVHQLGRTIEQSHIIWIWGSFFFDACRQGFSNASVQQNPLEGLLKQIAGPCLHSVCGLGWSCRICISNSSQVMLQVPKCGHTLRTTDTERNEKTFFKYDLIQIREQHRDREAWAGIQEPGEGSPLISPPLAWSPHLITQSMGQVKGSWIPWHIWMPGLPTEWVLAVGRGREQCVGWPHQQSYRAGTREEASWVTSASCVCWCFFSSLGSWHSDFKDNIRCWGNRGAGVLRNQTLQMN